jgi:hypothetical protein
MTDAPCGKMGPAAIVIAPRKAPRTEPNVERVLWASTAHLTGLTMARLDKPGGDWCCYPVEYGFLAYVYDADQRPEDMPDDLWACIEAARARRCAYIRFDCDADQVDGLPDLSESHG